LICISLRAKVLNVFMYLLAIGTSFESCLFSSCAHLLVGVFILLVFTFVSTFYILGINPVRWIKILSNSVGCLFTFVIVSFAVQKLFNLMQFNLSVFTIIFWAIRILFRKSLYDYILTLKSFTHFELILYKVRDKDLVSVFYVWISSFPHTIVCFWHFWGKSDGCGCKSLFLGPLFCSIDLCVCFCHYHAVFLSIIWDQLCSFYSGLLWLFRVFCVSIW
jgi:hypothetical protein